MKSKISHLWIVPLLLVFITACSDDRESDNPAGGDAPIVIRSGITTKASDITWDADDAIGVTMYEPDYSQLYDGNYNMKYVTANGGEVGSFEAESTSETLYFPQDGSDIRLRAYYPYQETLASNFLLPWSVADQLKLPLIDLMTAEHISGFNKNNANVQMRFYHRLSKLIFNLSLQDDGDFVPLAESQLTIHGMYTGDTYDLVGDEFLQSTVGPADITVSLRTGETDTVRQAIVLPRAAGQGISFELTTPTGDTYIAYMSDTLELKSGNQYIFNLRLSKNPITVSATIVPWDENPPQDYETLLVSTPAGPSEGVSIGDIMNVYLREDGGSDFSLLRQFTYTQPDEWTPDTPVYWEDIDRDPAVFRASIVPDDSLNSTQMPDILIADELTVARHTGADFTFRHAGSKVTVTLVSGLFQSTELDGAEIKLPNYLTGGHEENGIFVYGTDRADIILDRTDPDNSVAIFQPQTIAAVDSFLTVTINNQIYSVKDPDGFTFEPGTAYFLTVTVLKEGITVSARVVDWITTAPIALDVVRVGTLAGASEGVENGEILHVYYGNSISRTPLTNYNYLAAPVDSFAPATPVYWESLPDETTFYGYIQRPGYAVSGNNQLPDYLVADPIEVTTGNGVDFILRHATARVVVEVTSDDDSFSDTELEAMDIILPQYEVGATMQTGVFVPGENLYADVTIAKNVGANGNSGMALIQPQTRDYSSPVVQVYSPTSGHTYDAVYNQNIYFEAGVSTVLTVDMSKTAITISARVVDWAAGDSIAMVANKIQVTGTLGDTDDFFEDKVIYVYNLGVSPMETYTYSYEQPGGSGEYEWAGTEPVYWDDQPNLIFNMTGVYYPTAPPTLSGKTFPWFIGADQTDLANQYYGHYDLLMKHQEVTPPQPVHIEFQHVTSKVRVELIAGEGVDESELVGAEVILNDFKLSGTADIATGAIDSLTTAAVNDVIPYTETDGEEYTALVMPQAKAAGETILTVTLTSYPNDPFTGTMTRQLNFAAGHETLIRVTLSKTEIQLYATLKDWEEGDTGEIEIN